MPAVARRRAPISSVMKELQSSRADTASIVSKLIESPGSIPEILRGLSSDVARVRLGSAKVLRLLSEQSPSLLYRYFNAFVQMLDSDNAFLRWDATRIIGNLAAVDHQDKLEGILDRLMEHITDREMIGAATSIQSAARIALAKPHLADTLAKHILKVEFGIYKTPECRNIAIGHAIGALDQYFREIHELRQDVIEFVLRQRVNPRPATRKKAEAFFEKGML